MDWSGLTVLPLPPFSLPERCGAPAIAVGERQLPTGSRGQGWIRQTEAVLPVGARRVGTEKVTGGELRGGRWFGSRVGFGLRWSLVEAEALGSSARLWGSSWWCWIGGGSSGCDEWLWIAAATELAGDKEEGLSPTIAG